MSIDQETKIEETLPTVDGEPPLPVREAGQRMGTTRDNNSAGRAALHLLLSAIVWLVVALSASAVSLINAGKTMSDLFLLFNLFQKG